MAVAAALSLTMTRARCTSVTGADELSVGLKRLLRGQAQTFCYTDDAGRKIRFLLARGADGKVRSVFDACRQCYVYHKGYAVSGGDLVCRVCGNRYPIERMLNGKASCVPVRLPHRAEDDTVKIRVADMLAGRPLF